MCRTWTAMLTWTKTMIYELCALPCEPFCAPFSFTLVVLHMCYVFVCVRGSHFISLQPWAWLLAARSLCVDGGAMPPSVVL